MTLPSFGQRCTVAVFALALDAMLPELPSRFHPVVLMGRWLTFAERIAPASPRARLAWGAASIAVGIGGVGALSAFVPRHVAAQSLCAHTLLAYRALDHAVADVAAALAANNLVEARRLLGWHLVSRPTAELSAEEVAAAAIESLAENLSDSVVAPIVWCCVGGLPMLAAYRFSNTADAMWGYRTPRYEHLGKAAARLDDVLNWFPARLTALVIAIAAQVWGRGKAAWSVARREHVHTASPNAGWPMAAMAGALDTTLVKPNHYRLEGGTRTPDVALIGAARQIARWSVLGIVGSLLGSATLHSLKRR